MRLYLSSYRFGSAVERLTALVPPGARVAMVSNALDLVPEEARRSYARNVHDPLADLAAKGFARVPGTTLIGLMGEAGRPELLAPFFASWGRLETDAFMRDGGRYRRRRIANFAAEPGVPGHAAQANDWGRDTSGFGMTQPPSLAGPMPRTASLHQASRRAGDSEPAPQAPARPSWLPRWRSPK